MILRFGRSPSITLNVLRAEGFIKHRIYASLKIPTQLWYKKMDTCITPLPEVSSSEEVVGGKLKKWPESAMAVPHRITSGSVKGVNAQKFTEDDEIWKERVAHYNHIVGSLVTEPTEEKN
ncbi:hypothetical protein QQ045_002157 [Rhodiola kirilowii]